MTSFVFPLLYSGTIFHGKSRKVRTVDADVDYMRCNYFGTQFKQLIQLMPSSPGASFIAATYDVVAGDNSSKI